MCLQCGPVSLIRGDQSSSCALAAIVVLEVGDEPFNLMAEERARDAMRECEHFSFSEERKSEGVEGGGANVLRARRTERGELRYEVGSGSTCEGDGQNLAGGHAVLEEAADAAHESV